MTPIEAYIRQRAPLFGIDPDVAIRVAQGEGGLKNPFRHGEGPAPSSQTTGGATENSYGPFQLYISGDGAGLGDRALAAGIDPRTDWQGGIDYALNEASQKGWGQWYGAKAQGITGMMGINGDRAQAPAVTAVNRLAAGASPQMVRSVNFVPPPFSGQQANFQPLIGDEQPAPQSAAPGAPKAAPAPATAAPDPNADVLKAWGVDAGTPAPSQATPAAPEQDVLKTWGLDQNANAPAATVAAAPAEAPGSIGQTIGGAIDKGVSIAEKYGSPVVSFGNNLVRQIGTGVPIIGGALNKLDAATNAAIAPAINPFLSQANQLQGGTFAQRYQNSLAQQNGQDQQFQAAHPVISTGAQIAGGVGALGGLASAVPAVGTALGMTGNIATRTALGGLSGAAMGGTDAAVRSDGDPSAILNGTLLGGGLGAIAPTAGKLIGAGVNKLIGGTIPERVAQLAQLARDKFGINVGPGQLSTNPTIRFLDSVVNRLPFSGGTAAKAAQQSAFNKAVANSFGESASEVTPEVIQNAKSRIGQVFDSVADRTPAIKADGQFGEDLKGIINDAGQTLQSSEFDPLRTQMKEILTKFKDGGNQIDGATYQALTRKGAPLDRAMQSNDPNVSFYASKIRDALDGTLERSAPADALTDLQTARSQWKALKTVEPLANKSATGDISPALLMTQAAKNYGGAAYGRGSDLVDLGRIGQQFLKEAPSSGTAERSMLLNNPLLGGAGAGGAWGLATNPAAIPYALGGAVASGITSRGLGMALRSPYLGNKMIQSSLGNPGANLLLKAVPEGIAVPQVNQRQPLELTAHPNRLQ